MARITRRGLMQTIAAGGLKTRRATRCRAGCSAIGYMKGLMDGMGLRYA
ncbi:MAG TPA: hypothetical protein VN428_13915 [Bryobacteraceae bacterium]|nr:hypothetical protein [Bryobacteraceae bacterium]